MALNIKKGKIERPQKVVIYGPEGIGKSTLASRFPAPLYFDIEGGTAQLDVPRIDDITSWEQLMALLKEAATAPDYKTIVLDTADWAEKQCSEAVCAKAKKTNIEDFGYGKGYTYLQEEFAKLLSYADQCIAKGKNVVILAHAKMRKFEQPDEMGAYDRWEMKLTKQVAPMIKEWADMVLFLNYQTYLVEDDKTKSKKAKGGKRVIYTTHNPCWDAKNRHGLPEELPLEWAGPLAAIFTTQLPANLQQGQEVLGGTVETTTGQEVKKLSSAEVVKQLASDNNISEVSVMMVLHGAEMCSKETVEIDQVPCDVLEVVIKNWEAFKDQAMVYEQPF